jgi:cysteinyl-tRNA synthetase
MAKGATGQDFRYSMLTSSYRAQQNFIWEGVQAARMAISKIFGFAPSGKTEQRVGSPLEAIDNDLNIPEALGLFWKIKSSTEIVGDIFGLVSKLDDEVVPMDIENLVNDRKLTKDQKDFKKSDELRKQIEALGYEVMDTPEGQKVKKKLNI